MEEVSEHSNRVAELASALGKAWGLSPQIQQEVRLGGVLHDIGKVRPDINALTKKARTLSPEEWSFVHSVGGAHCGTSRRL